MWQSAAIAAGFGTYFQFAKRRVSAMSNEEFNKADPHELVNSMYEDIVQQIPSSFDKVDSLTPVMLQSMNVMLDQAVKWLQGAISGNFFGTPNPVNDGTDGDFIDTTPSLTDLLDPSFQNVKDWAITKLNLVHANQLHLYTSKAQGFIHSVHDFNKKDDDVPTPIPIDTLVPTGTFIFSSVKYPLIHKLIIKSLNENIRTKRWIAVYNTLRTQLNAATFRLTNAQKESRPSPTQIKLFSNQKLEVQNMIIDFNKFISTSGIRV